MRRIISLIVLVTCLGCTGITDAGKGTTYTTAFSGQFVESSVHQGGVVLNCTDTYNLTGTITVMTREPGGSVVDGNGSVNATHKRVGTTGQGCAPGPDRGTDGNWSADLTGTPAQFGFTVQRNGGTAFVVTTTYTFNGVLSGSSVPGTLTMTESGSGVTGGTTNSSSSASALLSVTLR